LDTIQEYVQWMGFNIDGIPLDIGDLDCSDSAFIMFFGVNVYEDDLG